ncbi:MAG: hypothetical protein QXL22_05665 [Candidatus Nezhaarchaeales archaeon]
MQGLEGARRYYEFKRRVVEHLCKSQVSSLCSKPQDGMGRATNYARICRKAKIGIAIEGWKDMYVMSLRSEPDIDLNKVLRILGKELGVKGDPRAAGVHA